MNQWLKAQQERMARLGLYQSTIDGEWGPATERAFGNALALVEGARGIKPPPYPALPSSYAWLNDIGPLPLIVHEWLKMLGTTEVPGAADSPIIMGWAKEVGVEREYTSDSIPWCGLGQAVAAVRAKKDITPVGGVLWARNWAKFGVPVTGEPMLGDTAVFKRGNAGHVATVLAIDDAGMVHIVGANQQDAVNIMRKSYKKDFLCFRRPIYNTLPASVKTYRVAATGRVSSNEA